MRRTSKETLPRRDQESRKPHESTSVAGQQAHPEYSVGTSHRMPTPPPPGPQGSGGVFGPFFDVKNPRKIGCEPLCGHRGKPRYRTPAAGDRGKETQTASAPATASVTQGTWRNFHSGQTSSKRTPSSRTETHPGRFRQAATPSRIERTEEGIPHRLILQTAKRRTLTGSRRAVMS